MLESSPTNSTPNDLVEPATAPRSDQPGVVELFNPDGPAPVLLICDHAGREIPGWLGDLGLPEHERARHIGWDIGAADATRHLAGLLAAPAVLCHVSRLVIDPNRHPTDPASIPEISDGTFVPGNQNLPPDEVRRRFHLSFRPYQRAVAGQVARLRRRGGIPVIISMHSFTPRMGTSWRPWDIAVLWDTDDRLARPVIEGLRADPALRVGDNEPYSGRYPVGYSMPFHATRTRMPHVTFELRQDLVETRPAAEAWAERLAVVLRPLLSDPKLYCLKDT